MVIHVGLEALECLLGYSRSASNVHVAAMRARAAATHILPIVHAVEVQQTMVDAFFNKHAGHDGAVGYRSMSISIAKASQVDWSRYMPVPLHNCSSIMPG